MNMIPLWNSPQSIARRPSHAHPPIIKGAIEPRGNEKTKGRGLEVKESTENGVAYNSRSALEIGPWLMLMLHTLRPKRPYLITHLKYTTLCGSCQYSETHARQKRKHHHRREAAWSRKEKERSITPPQVRMKSRFPCRFHAQRAEQAYPDSG